MHEQPLQEILTGKSRINPATYIIDYNGRPYTVTMLRKYRRRNAESNSRQKDNQQENLEISEHNEESSSNNGS